MSEVGTVQTVLDTGDIRVRYPSGHVWTMNVASVVKVHNSIIKITCTIIITISKAKVNV